MVRADLALLLVAAIWGTTFALLRDTMRVLHPAEVMGIRFTMATIVLGALFWKRIRRPARRWIVDGAWLGLWLGIGYLTQVMGLLTISASRSAFITSTYVVITPVLAFFALRARPGAGEAIGVVLAFAGLVAFSADAGFTLGAGDLWTLGCAFAFAAQIIVTHVVAKRSDPIALTVMQMAIGAAFGWVVVAARGGVQVPLSEVPWGVMIYLATAASALVITLQTWALARTSTVKAALIFTTEPIFAALFAAAFFAERMTRREFLGAALITAGVVLSQVWEPMLVWLRSRRAGARTGAPPAGSSGGGP